MIRALVFSICLKFKGLGFRFGLTSVLEEAVGFSYAVLTGL